MYSNISLEYLISDFSVFEKLNMIRRLSDIHNKVVHPEHIVFPKNTMLHLFDNFDHSDATTDGFDVTKYPFINNKTNIKYLHNFLALDNIPEEYLSKFSHRLYRSKLSENIRNFNLAHRKIMIPALSLDTVIKNRNCIIVENYNPLYRILSLNARPINQYYRYQMILSTALQNLIQYDKQHFLVIPVEDQVVINRTNILSIAQSKEVTSQRLLSTSHFYFFIIDLALLLLDNESNTSTFKCIPVNELSKINVILMHKDRCVLFNFGKIASIISNKAYLFGFLNTIASLTGVTDIELIDQNEQDALPEETQVQEEVIEDDFSDVTEVTLRELQLYYADKRDLANNLRTLQREKRTALGYGIYRISHALKKNVLVASMVIVTDYHARSFSSTYFAEDEVISVIENVYIESIEQDKGFGEKILQALLNTYSGPIFVKIDKSNKKGITFWKSQGFEETDIQPNDVESVIFGIRYSKRIIQPIVDKEVKPVIIRQGITPSSNRTPLIPISVRDDEKLKQVTDRMVLTEKQKNRIDVLADQYKEIKVTVNGEEKTIHEILNESVETSVKSEDLNIVNDAGIEDAYRVSCTHVFDENYRKNLLHRDILNNIISFRENGLFLTNYTERDEYNSFTRVKHVKAVFTDIRNKQHTINFKLPMPDDEGYYLVNGVHMTMTKQLVNVPICKISPTRVSLISNYNKTLVDKVSSVRYSTTKNLMKKSEELGITFVPKLNLYVGIPVPYEYKLFGRDYSKIVTKDYTFYFEYKHRFEFFEKVSGIATESLQENLQLIESKYGVLVGYLNTDRDVKIFMNMKNELTAVHSETFNKVEIPRYITGCFGDFKVNAEWCDLKILDKNIPIGFILCYRYGISKVLNNLKIDYRFVEKNTRQRVTRTNTEITIPFEDGHLVIDRYPLLHSYIISGLQAFNTLDNYRFIDLDGKDAYYGLLAEKGMSLNYLKGIDNYFSFFVDPITKNVLEEMGEPTNTRDLLIRAVELLITDTDKAPSAISNFRVRSAEKIPAMIYNEISRQYANYINSEFKDVSFSINTEAIFQRLIQDETMGLRETINPIHAVEYKSRVTHSGFGGRSSQAFVSRDRKYAKDAVGVISEATTDSGSVGMVAFLSSDPNIKNLRGMFHEEKATDVANTLSDVSLLMPAATHDDQYRSYSSAMMR